jgi:hypothetical protein
MKRHLIILIMVLTGAIAHAQVNGVHDIPGGTYPTIASAIAALNTQGVGEGGVIFNNGNWNTVTGQFITNRPQC